MSPILARTWDRQAAASVERYMAQAYFPSTFRVDWDVSCGCLRAAGYVLPGLEQEMARVAEAYLRGWEDWMGCDVD